MSAPAAAGVSRAAVTHPQGRARTTPPAWPPCSTASSPTAARRSSTRTFSVEEERAYIESLPARSFLHVAEAPGAGIVGFQTVIPWNTFVTTEFDHVATMGTYVDAAHRRQGVGAALARSSFAAALALGYDKIFTDLRADNLDSLAYHLALGFSVVGAARRHARVRGRDVDVLFIERFLKEG